MLRCVSKTTFFICLSTWVPLKSTWTPTKRIFKISVMHRAAFLHTLISHWPSRAVFSICVSSSETIFLRPSKLSNLYTFFGFSSSPVAIIWKVHKDKFRDPFHINDNYVVDMCSAGTIKACMLSRLCTYPQFLLHCLTNPNSVRYYSERANILSSCWELKVIVRSERAWRNYSPGKRRSKKYHSRSVREENKNFLGLLVAKALTFPKCFGGHVERMCRVRRITLQGELSNGFLNYGIVYVEKSCWTSGSKSLESLNPWPGSNGHSSLHICVGLTYFSYYILRTPYYLNWS